MEKKYEVIDEIIAGGVYLYIVFMFLSKGESIRNILIFGNFALWLLTLKHRKNLRILREPVSILFWLFVGITVCSVFFSIDPLYSFLSLRNDPLKPALLFVVIATVMSEKKRLERVIYVSCFTALLIVLISYYSYFSHDIYMLRPDVALMDTGPAGHNKFARYLTTLLPFMLPLYFLWDRRKSLKAFIFISLILSIFAIILSTSRGGYVAFISIVLILAGYLSRTRGYSLFKLISWVIAATLFLGILSWFSFPNVRERISRTDNELPTFNLRTEAWEPAIYAIKERPLVGWGYGDRIFHMDEPYENTPYKKYPPPKSEASPRGPHNTFLKLLFHQGLIGTIPYLLLIVIAIKVFWREALKGRGITSHVLAASVAIIIGNYILNSMLADVQFRSLSVVLGLGIAAMGIDENSHS
jgi:O-antigen ligase